MNYKQYDFKLDIKHVTINYQAAFNFKLQLKRGNKVQDSKSNYKYEISGVKEIAIGDEFTTPCIMQISEGNFKEKTYKIYLLVYTKQGFKSACYSEINMSDYINSNDEEIVLKFKKHPFAFLEITMNVSSKFVADIENINDTTRLSDGEDDVNTSVVIKKEPSAISTNVKQISLDSNKGKLEESENIIKELRERIGMLEQENKELSSKKEQKAGKTNEEVSEKEKIIEELKSEIEYYNNEISELKSIVEDLKTEKSRIYEEKIKAIKELKGEIESLNEKIQISEKSLINKSKELTELKNSYETQEANISKLNTKIVNIQ
jgi:hypothetical protein